MNSRPTDVKQLEFIAKKYEEMTEDEKDILENAILEIFCMFDLEPKEYQFDFRFNRR